MSLLDDQLRSRLPPLNSQEAEDLPRIYARFHLPGTDKAWYPIEGEQQGEDYLFFGFIGLPENKFGEFRLSALEAIQNEIGQRVERDLAFREGRLTDVVPAPEE